jgi:hypothetical protein
MRVTPSAVPDCAASVARHQYKRQRSVRVSLIQQDRRDIGRVRRGGWLLGRREPGQKMTLRRTCLSVPSSRASGEPGAPGTRGCLRTRRHGGVAGSITRRWPGGAAERSYEGLVVDASPMAATTVRPATWAAMDIASRGGRGRRWWCSRGVLVVQSMGSSNRRAGPFPPWTPVSLGQQSTVRPAGGDRPDEKTLDGQVGVGDDATAADLGPDPDAATRLSLNELAGMDCNRHGDRKQCRQRCPLVDEPAVCVRHDSLASRSARDWLILRAPASNRCTYRQPV